MTADVFPALVIYTVQTTLVVLLACASASALRLGPARLRYAYWRSVLALCIALPALEAVSMSVRHSVAANALFSFDDAAVLTGSAAYGPITVRTVATGVVVFGILLRAVWLWLGMVRLRRLRVAGRRVHPAADAQVQRALGICADVRYVDDMDQPVTFGCTSPVVLLPATLIHAEADIQRAVLCHELVHVQRRDWRWVVLEELVAATFWFHPAASWLISQIQLSREEVVDALAARLTGSRRSYAEALIAFGDRPGVSSAAAFGRRGHLVRRIRLVIKEERMSVTRMFVSAAVISVILAFGTWQTARAFPLVQRSTNSGGSDAQRLGPGIVSPKAVKQVKAEYPPEAKKAKIQGTVVAEVRIDTDGLVQEPRVVKSIPQLDAAAIAAVRQWKFTPALKNGKPVPVLVDITIRFTLK